eukprot:scpid47402/ scgid16261/ Netrin receptor UNC5B; Protein unc-5 homolog 2; Protein unc-5 homolog B; p53-regulated receptor for death and life protein 1
MGEDHRCVWRVGVGPRTTNGRSQTSIQRWMLVMLVLVCCCQPDSVSGICGKRRRGSSSAKYMDPAESICVEGVDAKCLLKPTYTTEREAGYDDCHDTPQFVMENHQNCTPPSAPQNLNATVTYWSKDQIVILVQWKTPKELCPLTGYRIAVWRGESQPRRIIGPPCLCFNIPGGKTSIQLKSGLNDCIKDCFAFDRVYALNAVITIDVTSLPLTESPNMLQTTRQEVILPNCKQLDPLPHWCRNFPPQAPELVATDLRNGSILLEWTEPFSDPLVNITGYKIEWFSEEQDERTPTMSKELKAHIRSFITSPDMVEFNITYQFWVTARSTATRKTPMSLNLGESVRSREAKIKIKSINGGWSKFSDWSPCVFCDRYFTTRYRNCTNPVPLFNGLPCQGKAEEKMPCNMTKDCIALTTNTLPWVDYPTVKEEEEESDEDTGKSEPFFYQKNTFFITLCVAIGCLLIILTFLSIVYRYYNPKVQKLSSTPGKQRYHNPTKNRYNPDEVSLGDQGMSPNHQEILPSAVENSSFNDSPTILRRLHCPPDASDYSDMALMDREPPTVYISYSRRQDELEAILNFCYWLHLKNINVIIDQWFKNEVAEDIAGWIQSKVAMCDYVISICSVSYNQAWTQNPGTQGPDDLRSILSEDFESDLKKRQYLETMLINGQLMRNGRRNKGIIPVVLVDEHLDGFSFWQHIPDPFTNSKVYCITETDQCQDALELLCRLYGVEHTPGPRRFQGPAAAQKRHSSTNTDTTSIGSQSTGQSTVSTTSAESYPEADPAPASAVAAAEKYAEQQQQQQ